MREDYLRQAQKVIPDPNILINVVSRRVKQLKYGARPTVESLEKLSLEDIALLEIVKGHIKYELYEAPKESEDFKNRLTPPARIALFCVGKYCFTNFPTAGAGRA